MSSKKTSPVFSRVEQISIEQARTGEPTASAGSVRIHSAYDPDREARKFLDRHLDDIPLHAAIIVIGAGLGYIDRILKQIRPDSKIIAIHLESRLYEARIDRKKIIDSVKRWHPEAGIDVESFLFDTLDETSISGLRVLNWPASVKIRRKRADNAAEALTSVIRRLSGNISATAAFGRLWIRNTLRNFLEMERVVYPSSSGIPVVLAASGPGLESTLGILQKHRTVFQLWALPSSIPALMTAGIKPDLIIATDPGYWARLHGRYYIEDVPIAMPLSAAPRPIGAGAPLLLPQGIPGEAFLLKNEEWPRLQLPAMGTVAATAVEAWRQMSTGPLILTGLDLCWHDLRSHARPHAFDGWLSSQTCRHNPMNNIAWERAMKLAPKRIGAYRIGSALQTYTDWFRNNIPTGRIIRLIPQESGTSVISIPGIPDQGPDLFRKLPKNPEHRNHFSVAPSPENLNQRHGAVRDLIARWQILLNSPMKDAGAETLELMYTIDPGGVLELERCCKTEYHKMGERHLERVKNIINRLETLYA